MTIDYKATTIEAIKAMTDAISATEQARKDGKPYAGKGELLDIAKDKVNEANKAIVKDAIDLFVGMINADLPSFVKAYWNDWTVDGFKVVQDSPEDGGEIHSEAKTLRIPYSAIDTASKVKITSNGAWRKYLQIYGDNCMAFIADNDKGEKALSVKTTLPTELANKRKELVESGKTHWGKHSHSALVKQLNDLAEMVFPEGLKPDFHMVSVDQKVVTACLTKGKKLDGMGAATLQMANQNTLEAILFTEIYTRMNNLAINLETGLKEKEQAKKNEPKSAEAKGGDVSGESVAKETPKETVAA